MPHFTCYVPRETLLFTYYVPRFMCYVSRNYNITSLPDSKSVGLADVPADVRALSVKAVYTNSFWPTPTLKEIKTAIKSIPASYSKEYERVNICLTVFL